MQFFSSLRPPPPTPTLLQIQMRLPLLGTVAGEVQYSQSGTGPERVPVALGNFQYVCEMIALEKRQA